MQKNLTQLGRRSLPYRNQSNDLLCKSIDLFLYVGTSVLKELIKRKSKIEVYSEPCQTSDTKLVLQSLLFLQKSPFQMFDLVLNALAKHRNCSI